MPRPCFLVLDPEHAGTISTRKLIIETAKFNVVTAYTGAELIESLQRFPNVDAAVVDARLQDMPTPDVIHGVRSLKPSLPIVVISSPGAEPSHQANYEVNSLEPRALLDILRSICPGESEAIARRDKELEEREL